MNLSLNNLSVGYGSKIVVDDITAELPPGEVICLLGANGSGKTTLFKAILRLLRPKSGNIKVGSEDIAQWRQQRLARTFGYVPQMHTPPFAFLVRDVVLMARAAHLGPFAAPGVTDERIADESLERLGIRRLAPARYTEISGGERQLVLIARALAQQPQWLILDEPTANLDFGNQIRVLQSVAELASAGLGVLMTTHMPDHAFLCAARVVLMSQGRILAMESPEIALTEDALFKAYGVPLHIEEVPSQPGKRMVVPNIS
jgi:iron complex transport system ATP-binding protein